MALPATDTFTGITTDQSLTAYSGNWTVVIGAMRGASGGDAVGGNFNATDSIAYWNADAFGDDQYSEVTVHAGAVWVYAGPAVRISSTGGGAGYYALGGSFNDSTLRVKRVSGGVITDVTTSGSPTSVTVPADNSVIRIEAVGSTITVYDDGVEVWTYTDGSPISSGSAGIANYAPTSAQSAPWATVDNFEAGNLGGGSSIAPGSRISLLGVG